MTSHGWDGSACSVRTPACVAVAFKLCLTPSLPMFARRVCAVMGFFVCALTFGACAVWYDTLSQTRYLKVFQFLYYTSTFFGQVPPTVSVCVCIPSVVSRDLKVVCVRVESQWGPNATTWLLPSELFPTEIRAFAHGVSAAAGKLGALIAGLTFAHVNVDWQFGASALCGIVGFGVTLLFIPDVSALDIEELDDRWIHLKAGTPHLYTGAAVSTHHLSLWERWTRGKDAEMRTPLKAAQLAESTHNPTYST